MHRSLLRSYKRARAKGYRASEALYHARTLRAWEWAEYAGLVRMRWEPDECATFEDLEGDTFRPECHPDIPRSRIEREREAFRAEVEREGVWYVVAEYRTDPDSADWHHGDSIGGIIGTDEDASGYDDDLRATCLAELRSALRARPRPCPTCGERAASH